VKSAQDMLNALLNESADALVMAAAAADFRPKEMAKDKLKKRDGIPQIQLEGAPDILKAVSAQSGVEPALSRVEARRFKVTVGFAAESQDLLQNASEKLKSKGLDFIAANDISARDAGFAVETNRITLLFADGTQEPLPLMSKSEAAEKIIEHIARLLK
jgi:phosphopantothenoylcysteine decarboxylase/phosphopantothenate--cysteine ligase